MTPRAKVMISYRERTIRNHLSNFLDRPYTLLTARDARNTNLTTVKKMKIRSGENSYGRLRCLPSFVAVIVVVILVTVVVLLTGRTRGQGKTPIPDPMTCPLTASRHPARCYARYSPANGRRTTSGIRERPLRAAPCAGVRRLICLPGSLGY